MEKTVTIDGKEVKLSTSAALPRIYRRLLRRDVFADVAKMLLTSIALANPEKPDPSDEDQLEASEIIENLTYCMAKHADPRLPDTVEEWLSGFADEAALNDSKITGAVIDLWMDDYKSSDLRKCYYRYYNGTNIRNDSSFRAMSHIAQYDNLIKAARKAVEHGYRVYLLPNPKGIRTADFIFVRKGVLKLFDLKTITGKNSVGNRLAESIGQTERVLLNMQTDYNIRRLTLEIKRYFEMSAAVQEVLIYSGGKEISIKRNIASSKGFLKMMMNSFR